MAPRKSDTNPPATTPAPTNVDEAFGKRIGEGIADALEPKVVELRQAYDDARAELASAKEQVVVLTGERDTRPSNPEVVMNTALGVVKSRLGPYLDLSQPLSGTKH